MEFYLFLVVIIAGFIGIFWYLKNNSQHGNKDESQDKSLLMLQQQINQISETLDKKLGESNKTMQEAMRSQFGQSAKIIQDVTEKLTKLDETNKQVVNFADQLKSLQDILKNPKQRGVLGEYYLETVLKNVLPPGGYNMQYAFKNGDIVDAVVFIQDKIVPIDSKFSLENYERILKATDNTERVRLEKEFKNDLKKRIEETSKYIRPSENTMDFAFMFIPSEAIYYDLLINKVGAVKVSTQDLIEYAFKEKHVIIVSPTSFLAYLQTVLQGLRALKIEESAKEIRKNVEKLSKHMLNYDSYLQKMGSQLGTVVNTYNLGYKEFKKIDKDVMKITDSKSDIEVVELDKPKIE